LRFMTNIAVFVEQLREDIADFRKPQGIRYDLHNLLTIMVLAIAACCEDFESMAAFCHSKADFLIANGLLDGKRFPSHDLFRWLLQNIDKKAFGSFLVAWLESTDPQPAAAERDFVHIDGKVLRATRTSEHSRTGLVVLNAYCSASRVVIGAELLESKTSEQTAIPALIEQLHLQGSIVTIDAIASTRDIAARLRAKGAHYLLPLKKNNKLFFREVEDFFRVFGDTALVSVPVVSQEHQAGRTEVRSATMLTQLQYLPDAAAWKDLKTIVCVERSRTIGEETTRERVYYLSSLEASGEALLEGIRRHWTIENHLHWHLDVSFREDAHRLADKNAALCFALLRRFVLSLLKRQLSKESIKNRRLNIAWNDKALACLLQELPTY
jgi:predicted transposase YbfD/YdcC